MVAVVSKERLSMGIVGTDLGEKGRVCRDPIEIHSRSQSK